MKDFLIYNQYQDLEDVRACALDHHARNWHNLAQARKASGEKLRTFYPDTNWDKMLADAEEDAVRARFAKDLGIEKQDAERVDFE